VAFPELQGTSGKFVSSANSTTHAVPYPTVTGGILANDLLLAVFSIDESATGTVVSNWNGFTQIFWGDVATAVSAGGAAYKRAAGGETGTITFTTNNSERSVCNMWCIRGAHTTSAPEAGTAASASSTNPDPPNVTASWGSDDNLFVAVAIDDTVVPSAAPTNYTSLETAIGTSTGTIGVAFRPLTAASDNPGVFTMATEQWLANTIVIRPAPVAENFPPVVMMAPNVPQPW